MIEVHDVRKACDWAERIRAAKWAEIEAEQNRVDTLFGAADNWHESLQLREYIEAVRDDAIAKGVDTGKSSEMGQWLAWAREQADRHDPLCESPPSILDDASKYKPRKQDHYW